MAAARLALLAGWVVAVRVVDGERVFTARRGDLLLCSRHAWVLRELLDVDADGFAAASWQRWEASLDGPT